MPCRRRSRADGGDGAAGDVHPAAVEDAVRPDHAGAGQHHVLKGAAHRPGMGSWATRVIRSPRNQLVPHSTGDPLVSKLRRRTTSIGRARVGLEQTGLARARRHRVDRRPRRRAASRRTRWPATLPATRRSASCGRGRGSERPTARRSRPRSGGRRPAAGGRSGAHRRPPPGRAARPAPHRPAVRWTPSSCDDAVWPLAMACSVKLVELERPGDLRVGDVRAGSLPTDKAALGDQLDQRLAHRGPRGAQVGRQVALGRHRGALLERIDVLEQMQLDRVVLRRPGGVLRVARHRTLLIVGRRARRRPPRLTDTQRSMPQSQWSSPLSTSAVQEVAHGGVIAARARREVRRGSTSAGSASSAVADGRRSSRR